MPSRFIFTQPKALLSQKAARKARHVQQGYQTSRAHQLVVGHCPTGLWQLQN